MDEARLAETAAWGRKLADQADGAELRAAGRAIQLLVAEVERLQAELATKPDDDDRPGAPPPAEVGEPLRQRPGRRTLRSDLSRIVGGLSHDYRPPRGLVVALSLAAAALLAAGAFAGARSVFAPSLHVAGPPQNAELGPQALQRLSFVADADASQLPRQRWTLDGENVTGQVRVAGAHLVLVPTRLADGEHEVSIRVGGGFLGSSTTRTFRFSVDTTPPQIVVPHALAARKWAPLVVKGRADGAVQASVNGQPVRLSGSRFSVRLSPAPAGVEVAAKDSAGNVARSDYAVMIVPRRPPAPVRAVHVTFDAWADPALHRGVMRLIDQRRINTVEIDLKDEAGVVGFEAPIPLAQRIGAMRDIIDLGQVVRELHERGIRVIGRLVCFRDPILASAAWKQGHRDEVIQTPDGQPYSGYGGFTNFANPAVRRYNIDIAVAAAKLGVDDVLYDYVRRPDGPISSMVFPGLVNPPETAIVEFLRETRAALRPYGTFVGASVFGVAADRPEEVAQLIPAMARQLDYVSPMVYPSHWAPGEYNVSDPNAEPYPIVKRSLRAFERDVRGTGARLVPWLQDFTLGVDYGRAQVKAQIVAARSDGVRDFLLWDPAVTYTSDALARTAHKAMGEVPGKLPTGPAVRKPRAPGPAAQGVNLHPNELGVIPVLMHHQIRADRVGVYDQTPAEFRHELQVLWAEGYWPVRAIDLATGNLNVPAGKTPVVLTFDDSTSYQFAFDRHGRVKPNTAVGIMLRFARTHPGFHPTGTFYVLRGPFGGVADGSSILQWLAAHHFELGNHTRDHAVLGKLSPEQVRRELVLGQKVITDAVPHARVRTMALPFGSMPAPASLAQHGTWHGQSYDNLGVFLVGANPAPSPFSRSFDPGSIPRIRSSHYPWSGAQDFTAAFWLDQLRRNPGERYVSDGNPKTITFPRVEESQLAPRFRSRARPY